MTFEIEIIKFIQGMRSHVMDALMEILTQLGDQFAFIGVALVLYWFINKRMAYKLVIVFIFSAVTNEILKGVFRRNRPYMEDLSLNVGEMTPGYSMPSGHAQNTAVVSTVLYQAYGKKVGWLKWILIPVLFIVPFTRMYLGQHYLSDVLVGLIVGGILAYYLSKLVDLMADKEHIYGLYLLIPLGIMIVVLAFLDVDYIQIKNFYVAMGGFSGFVVGYFLEKKYVQNDFKPIGWRIVWRTLVGLSGVVILYLGLSYLFDLIMVDNVYLDFMRYASIGLWGSVGAMYVFKQLKV